MATLNDTPTTGQDDELAALVTELLKREAVAARLLAGLSAGLKPKDAPAEAAGPRAAATAQPEAWRVAYALEGATELSDMADLFMGMSDRGESPSPDLLRMFALRMGQLSNVFTGAVDTEWTQADTRRELRGAGHAAEGAEANHG